MKSILPFASLLLFLPFSAQSNQEKEQPVVDAVVTFIETASPLFETTYLKGKDGSDQKYTDFLISSIQSAPPEDQLVKSLASFSAIMASLSKEEAKLYGSKIGQDEKIQQEYVSYLYLFAKAISSEEEKNQIYLQAIRSIAFHLKVKEVPIYENLELINGYVEEELLTNSQTLSLEDSFRINQFQLHFLFSFALENYGKFLSVAILEEDQNPAFDKLGTQRAELTPKAKNVNELSIAIKSISDPAYSEINRKLKYLLADYLGLVNDLLWDIIYG